MNEGKGQGQSENGNGCRWKERKGNNVALVLASLARLISME